MKLFKMTFSKKYATDKFYEDLDHLIKVISDANNIEEYLNEYSGSISDNIFLKIVNVKLYSNNVPLVDDFFTRYNGSIMFIKNL